MSDTYVRVIPSDPWWQPAPEAAQEAASYVAGLFEGEGVAVDEVGTEFHERVHVIDAGENTSSVTCSVCGWQLGPDFVARLTEANPQGLRSLDVWVPCCGAVVPVTSHRYDWPVGFARFEVVARNPTRDTPWLEERELDQVAGILGHPVFQVLAHY
ncbi:hypothetical protein [Oryzobacter terrae]|uniref:hypothetical protein n=1 Tax=Oryzobacter terrae TaxID=1620385 RepID=UPI00366CB963